VNDVTIPVFSSKYTAAWGKGEDFTVTDAMEYPERRGIVDCLQTEYATDAHGAGYFALTEGNCYRLGKDCIRNEEVRSSVRLQVAMLDLDRNPHVAWESAEAALEAVVLLRTLFPDAAIFTTRRGVRLVYVFEQPLMPVTYEHVCQKLILEIATVLEASGVDLEVDTTTTQWTRLFRMPKVVRDGNPTWTEPGFALDIPTDWRAISASVTTTAAVTPEDEFPGYSNPNLPQVAAVTDEEWDFVIKGFAEAMARSGMNGLLGKLRAGIPFFEAGKRNETTYRTLAKFLEIYYSLLGEEPDPEEVYRLFYASTAATNGQASQEEALVELWGMISRMVDARRYAGQVTHQPLPRRYALTPDGNMPILAYTGGRSRYVWDKSRNNYTDPIGNSASLKAIFANVWGPTYRVGVLPEEQLLHTFGTHVDEVVLDLGAERPRLEENQERGRRLILPVGCRMTAKPKFHADVAEWLQLLGGDDPEGLLDWLHWSLQLDQPLCALYLCGPKGAGKGMIVQALAAFWSGQFVKFDEAVSRFNGRLRDSPVIWLDETSESTNTGEFRSLVGNATHSVERKFMDSETLQGHIRMLIMANNDNALSLDDVKTVHDVEAVTQRVRFIRVPEAASQYLKDLGGSDYTRKLGEEWVSRKDGTPGKIGEHIAWLHQNHAPVSKGNRFCVEGIPTSWHYRALYSGDVGAVLSVLAEELAKNNPHATAKYDTSTEQVVVNVVGFLASAAIKSVLKNEGVDIRAARFTLESICRDSDTFRRGDSIWAVVPKSVVADMPQTTYRKEATYWRIQELLNPQAAQQSA